VRKDVLSMFLKVDNIGAEQMSSGRLLQTTGPATQNARLIIVFILKEVRPLGKHGLITKRTSQTRPISLRF